MRRYASQIVRHAWLVLAVAVLATAIVATGTSRLTVDLDPEQQLPADHPYVQLDRRIRSEFGGRKFVALAIVPRSGTVWRREVLEVVHGLTLDVLGLPGVIRQNVLSLSSPYVRIPRERDGVLSADYVMREVPRDAAEVAAVRDLYRSEPLVRGTVVSDDERAALVLADFFDDTAAGDIAGAIQALATRYRSADADIAVTGGPIFQDFEASLVRRQGGYFAATVVAVLLVLWLVFGQVQGVILPAATALLSAAVALGCMGFAGIPMNAWTAAAPMLVVTVAAGHSAQMLKRYYEEFARTNDRRLAVVESTARIGAVMIAAGTTAGSGFAALTLLGIPVLAQLGVAVACGIFAAVILEMTFMLALRAVWPSGRGARDGPLSRALDRILPPLAAGVARRPRLVVACFVATTLLAAAGFPRLTSEIDARVYWSKRTALGRDLRVFERHFPSTTTLTVLLEGEPGAMQTPEAIAVMSGLQQTMAAGPGVGRTSSIADIVRRTYEVFAPEEAAHGLPMQSDLIAQLFFLSSSPAFERYVDRAYSRAVVFGFLDREDTALTRQVIARLEAHLAAHPPGRIRVALAGGVGPTMLALNDHTVEGKMLNIAVVFAVIFVIAGLLLRTPLGGVYVTAPLVMALIVNLGAFAWVGIPFDLSGASTVAMGVSIGADYAIYALYRLREECGRGRGVDRALRTTMETTGRAVLFVAMAIGAGFVVYLVSDFHAFRVLGLFVPLTMMVSALTAITLLPALVVLRRPRFVVGASPAAAPVQRRRVVTRPARRASMS